MALNGTQMGDEVAAAILAEAYGGALSEAEQNLVHHYWRIICNKIVDHIVANGHALPGTFKDSLGGALTGEGEIE